MEERTGWSGAFGTAWKNLTGVNNERNVRTIRFIFFIVFLLGTAWAIWSYLQAQILLELEVVYATPGPSQAQADKKRLDAMILEVEGASKLRAGSPETVQIMEDNLARYPFGEPKLEPVIPSIEEDGSGKMVVVEPLPVVVIDYPPDITLRGIMIIGKQQVAVMDIPGVGTGMIVRVGDTFMQKKGRVVRIAPDKVVVNWGGRNWDIAPNF